jgi:hypothetical protein
MKKIDIQITKAALKSFSVELQDKKPVVSASIALLTEGGKVVTDYSISTDSWQDENKFELPMECIAPIVELARKLELVVTKHCRDSQLALPAKAMTIEDIPTVEQAKTETVIEDVNDEPINLDDIPF